MADESSAGNDAIQSWSWRRQLHASPSLSLAAPFQNDASLVSFCGGGSIFSASVPCATR